MIDEDRWERTSDDVRGFLSEKASRSASVNEFKLTCESITGRDNELGLKSGQEKENTASFSTSFASTKLTKERPSIMSRASLIEDSELLGTSSDLSKTNPSS